MNLSEIYLQLQNDINIIETSLEQTIRAENEVLRQASTDLLKAGGKRIRPVFVLLSGKFGHYDINVLKHIAVPLELIHMASLVHDDVIDDADLRRGKKTVKSQWDNRIAMYTGDYIFGKAIEQASFFDNQAMHRILSFAMKEMCVGEVEQIRDQFNWDQNLKQYLRRIKRKTALLIAISCELGAIASGAPKSIQRHLYYFGYYVGMSFQIIDDVLDFIGTEKQLGKPAGGDLLQGNITLPALYTLNEDPEFKDLIVNALHDPFTAVDLSKFIKKVSDSGGIEYALAMSDRYLQKAHRVLEKLPDNEAKVYLSQIATYIGRREF
ncbi:heptaprenyl diphosphate synthase component II [Bacillus alkalicellulosilyticus]|uniref:heptaprenyl diphosphate synthase component II n=1 Tax=Alkalihalobacterium alkalicellulosilyticum TaxID=1912214 RepID=UPI0009979105|nr:heptaprenyl diphosphate synthase component II [Bacillus alkalicellulosilyticus]